MCKSIEIAWQFNYERFPKHFVSNKTSKKWKIRQCGFVIRRLYFVDLIIKNRFCLWFLFIVVYRLYLFEDLRIVNIMLQPNFKITCLEIGLLKDNKK